MGTRAWVGRRPASALAVAALAFGASVVGGCDGGSTPGPGGITPVEPTVTTRETDSLPQGEIWQWALGRNAWTDPALAKLASSLGRSSTTDIVAHSYGFELDLDDAGTVVAVVLYNDEDALGLPASETSFRAYAGTLPGGLSWRDSYDTVVARYGSGQDVTGGWGVEYTSSYVTSDGGRLDVSYVARHASELPASRIHTVTVRIPSG